MEVEKEGNIKTYFTSCEDCAGIGKKTRKISKKARLQYQISLEKYSTSTSNQIVPTPPIGQKYSCKTCNGTGILTPIARIYNPCPYSKTTKIRLHHKSDFLLQLLQISASISLKITIFDCN